MRTKVFSVTNFRRRMSIVLERVHDYYQRHLLGRIYAGWKQALTRNLLIQQHEHRLAELQERVLKRWAFEQWKSCSSSLSSTSFMFSRILR